MKLLYHMKLANVIITIICVFVFPSTSNSISKKISYSTDADACVKWIAYGGLWNIGLEGGVGVRTKTKSKISHEILLGFAFSKEHYIDQKTQGYWYGVKYRYFRRLNNNFQLFAGLGAFGLLADKKTSDALDCLYCSNSYIEFNISGSLYPEIGFAYKRVTTSILYRLADSKGTIRKWGYDPYGVGNSWDESTPHKVYSVILNVTYQTHWLGCLK